MTTSPEIHEIANALSLAQGDIKPASKDSTNPHFRSKYADMASVIEAVREPLAKHGLSVVQEMETMGGRDAEMGVSVITRILHSSGQWIEVGPLTVPMSKVDAHGVGSAASYAKRYALTGALNVSSMDADDDGNASIQAPPPPPPPGFDVWIDNLTEVADSGTAALEKAWSKSAKECRAYLTTQQPDRWTNLKLSAAAVSADDAP